MKQFEHGGNVWKAAKNIGVSPFEIIDLSTCVADCPPHILQIFNDISAKYNTILPEPYSQEFSAQYKIIHGLDTLLCAGTSEAIAALCRIFSGETALIQMPSYSDYERLALLANMQTHFITDLSWGAKDESIVFICNPNNPTGAILSKEEILDFAQRTRALVVVDESYMPFTDGEHSVLSYAGGNLAVLRSYSKCFGIPGLRAGYITGDSKLLDTLRKQLSPWSVSTVAQQVALKLLEFDEHCEIDPQEKSLFINALYKIKKLKPIESSVHYNLCELRGITSAKAAASFLKHGILVRDCSNIAGIGDNRIRVSMRKGWERIKGVKL